MYLRPSAGYNPTFHGIGAAVAAAMLWFGPSPSLAAGPVRTESTWETGGAVIAPPEIPWRRTRDGWELLAGPSTLRPRSSFGVAALQLHPFVVAAFLALFSLLGLVAFESSPAAEQVPRPPCPGGRPTS